MLADRSRQRGDTIIEVLLAITIFSLVGIGAVSIMNEGVNTTQRALEITQVRQQIDAQVDALQAAHQAYSALPDDDKDDSQWLQMIDGGGPTSTMAESGPCPQQSDLTGGVFAMNPNATVMSMSSLKSIVDQDEDIPVVYSQIHDNSAYGLWVERTEHQADNPDLFPTAYDFRVRACWIGAGMTAESPMRIETLVRLYDVTRE